MIRNNKKYRVFSVLEVVEIKDFVNYCKDNNKIISKEIITAIKFYLQNQSKTKKEQR